VPAAEVNATAALGGVQAFTGQHDAGGHELFVEGAHFGQFLFAGHAAGFGVGVGLHDHHHFHCGLPWGRVVRALHWVQRTRGWESTRLLEIFSSAESAPSAEVGERRSLRGGFGLVAESSGSWVWPGG
jgi:hypothetical protein